jgi:thiamine monophosphate kinase
MDSEIEAGEPKPCALCDILTGILGVLAGMGMIYIGVDLITGGRITRMIGTVAGQVGRASRVTRSYLPDDGVITEVDYETVDDADAGE